MSSSSLPTSRRTVSSELFEQLGELLHHAVGMRDEEFHIMTDLTVRQGVTINSARVRAAHRFTLVASRSFSGLLQGQVIEPELSAARSSDFPPSETPAGDESGLSPSSTAEGDRPPNSSHATPSSAVSPSASVEDGAAPLESAADPSFSSERYQIDLTFEPRAIASFMRNLAQDMPTEAPVHQTLKQALPLLQINSPNAQTEFTLQLFDLLTQVPVSVIEKSILVDEMDEELTHRTQILHDAMLAAQAADQAKSEFLAAMSHELRTPLTYILGMSATLLRWSSNQPDEFQDEALKERQHHYLQNIHTQGEHLLELINDILDLSQLESGKIVLDLQEFSLSLLAQQSLKLFMEKARTKGIELELHVQVPRELDQFTGDSRRIRQVIINLLSNAIKFTPPGGKVALRLSANQSTAIIQVKDTGIGIPEHLQADIFQKFRQLDSSYRRQYEGTGLGLALTKQLIDLHGGRIECSSTVNVGTVFTVHLPRHPFSRSHSGRVRPFEPVNQPLGRIVLIESHNESAHVVSDMLTAAGYQLIWMLEGLAAVNQVELLQPAAVIVSTRLPDADSHDIIHRLRQNPLTKHLKIIALGSVVMIHEKSSYEAAGADHFLTYPMRPEDLLHAVSLAVTSKIKSR